jgi:phosphatidylglycerol:prolipoprotein diacylglycerol transferase
MKRLLALFFLILALAPGVRAAAANASLPPVADAPLPPEAAHYFVAQFDPLAVRFPAGWFLPGIRWYGLAYVAGFLVASGLMWLYARKGRLPLDADQRSTLLFAMILGIMLGGRLGYYLFYVILGDATRRAEFFADPAMIFRIWEGGMASHGAFIGGLLGLWWFARKNPPGFLRLGDVVATLAPPGVLFGRLANFVNGELWGKPATVPWAMIFPIRDGSTIIGYTVPRHPSQLYEAATEGLLLLLYTQWRWWKSKPPGSPGALPPGQLAGEYLIGYALVRIFCEIFREPDAPLLLGLSRGTFFSLFMILAGAFLIWRARRAPTAVC